MGVVELVFVDKVVTTVGAHDESTVEVIVAVTVGHVVVDVVVGTTGFLQLIPRRTISSSKVMAAPA